VGQKTVPLIHNRFSLLKTQQNFHLEWTELKVNKFLSSSNSRADEILLTL